MELKLSFILSFILFLWICMVNYTPLFKKLNFGLKTTSWLQQMWYVLTVGHHCCSTVLSTNLLPNFCGVLCCGWPSVYPLVGEPQIYEWESDRHHQGLSFHRVDRHHQGLYDFSTTKGLLLQVWCLSILEILLKIASRVGIYRGLLA